MYLVFRITHGYFTTSEFNMTQDINASRVLLDSGVPLIQVPCANVAVHLRTTIHEMAAHLANKNKLCDYLLSIYQEYVSDQLTYSLDPNRHFIRVVDVLDRDYIFGDLFNRLGGQQ